MLGSGGLPLTNPYEEMRQPTPPKLLAALPHSSSQSWNRDKKGNERIANAQGTRHSDSLRHLVSTLGFSLSHSHGRTNTRDWDPNESPVTPVGPTLRRTSTFLYVALNIIWKIPSIFRTVCFQHAPSICFLALLPQCGGIPLPPRYIDRPSAAFAAASWAAITFCDAISAPSLPRVPLRSMANATCTAWGHHWSPSTHQKNTQPSSWTRRSKPYYLARSLIKTMASGSISLR